MVLCTRARLRSAVLTHDDGHDTIHQIRTYRDIPSAHGLTTVDISASSCQPRGTGTGPTLETPGPLGPWQPRPLAPSSPLGGLSHRQSMGWVMGQFGPQGSQVLRTHPQHIAGYPAGEGGMDGSYVAAPRSRHVCRSPYRPLPVPHDIPGGTQAAAPIREVPFLPSNAPWH